MTAVAVRVMGRDGLAVELCDQDVRDGAMHGLRRVLQDIGEADMQPSIAKPDRRVQRRKPPEADIERRNRSSRAKLAVLLFKQR